MDHWSPVERWTTLSGIRIRYLDNAPDGPMGLPILFSPGLTDIADEYEATLEYFLPRRVLVVEVRGRGQSEAPPNGYSAADHMGDLAAVVEAEKLSRFHLMTFSRGTSWALDLAFAQPSAVATISIGDYRAAEIGLGDEFADHLWTTTFRGRKISERVERHVLEELARASRPRELYEELGALGKPVLVAKGVGGGIVDEAVIERYRSAVADLNVVTIPEAGHDLFRPSRTAYPAFVREFLATSPPEG